MSLSSTELFNMRKSFKTVVVEQCPTGNGNNGLVRSIVLIMIRPCTSSYIAFSSIKVVKNKDTLNK